MTLHITFDRERFLANRTFVRSFTCMRSDMSLQMIHVDETFATIEEIFEKIDEYLFKIFDQQ